MFNDLPFDCTLDFLEDDSLKSEAKKIDGIFYIDDDGEDYCVNDELNGETYYLNNDLDKERLKEYLNSYVYFVGEVYPDETCSLFHFTCKKVLKLINQYPELDLDIEMIQSIYYLTEKQSELLINIMVSCAHKEKYTGPMISHAHLETLTQWLLKRVRWNTLLKKKDIFEDVYLPSGQKMNDDVYKKLNEISNFNKMHHIEHIQYLLFVNTEPFQFNHLFYDTYELYIKKYPNFKDEIMQIMNYLFSMNHIHPMNVLFNGSNISHYLTILKDMSEYLGISVIEFSVSSFGDAGDLSGFNATYTGAEKGRLAEELLKIRNTGCILILKGLDEVNKTSSSHSSVLAALYEILYERKLNDNFLKCNLDLQSTFIVGTCFDERNVHSSISDLFYSIKKNNHEYKDLIYRELNTLLKSLNLSDIKIENKAVDRIVHIANMDPFDDMYKKYCKLIVHYIGNKVHGTCLVINEELVQEVFDKFHVCSPSMKFYYENYNEYNDDIIQKFKQYFFELKHCDDELKKKVQNKIEYLSCCKKDKFHELDLEFAEAYLNETHIGLDHVKGELLNALYQYPLCHVEPVHLLFYSTHPGVGKTSIAIDACKACDLPYIHINCAQISSLSSLYGDSFNPGLLLSKIKEVKTIQAPIFLDEFEKCDVAIQNSLLNLVDTENASFYSPYLEVNVPIRCRFILATANDVSKVSNALMDRFRLVEFKPYSIQSKLDILKNKIIQDLDKQYHVCFNVDEQVYTDYLLSHPFASIRDMKSDFNISYIEALRKNKTCLEVKNHQYRYHCSENTINGLGVVGNQGCAFKIECLLYDGEDQLKGNCKDVFKESFDIVLMALRYSKILSNEKVFMNIYGNSLEKNGPSAGLAMFACIYGKKMNVDLHDYAFTGELTIHGNVEAVGGIYYKLLACKQAGIHKVVLPYDNYKDYLEISNDLDGIEVYFVKNIFECMELLNK